MRADEPAVDKTSGLPYQALARAGDRRFLSPILDTLLIAALWFLLGLVAMLLIACLALLAGAELGDGIMPEDPAWLLALIMAGIATGIPATRFAARRVQGRHPGTLSSVEGRLRWRWLLICAGWSTLLIAVSAVATALLGGELDLSGWPGWSTYGPTLAVTILGVPLQAAAEEYLFRGWLIQSLTGPRRPVWLVSIISSALFVAAHGPSDAIVALDLGVFGLVACWVTVATGGLEAAIALHTVNNLVALSVAGAQGPIEFADSATESVGQLAASVIALALFGWWIARVSRRRGVRTRA